jgi:hypothetical protein
MDELRETHLRSWSAVADPLSVNVYPAAGPSVIRGSCWASGTHS